MIITALGFDLSVLEDYDTIRVGHVVKRMSDEKHSFVFEHPLYGHRKEEGSHMSVNSTENVVQNVDVRIAVEGSGEGESGSLSS